jgi:hypothetical protein
LPRRHGNGRDYATLHALRSLAIDSNRDAIGFLYPDAKRISSVQTEINLNRLVSVVVESNSHDDWFVKHELGVRPEVNVHGCWLG